MFDTTVPETVSTDTLERQLAEAMALKSGLDAIVFETLEELDRRQVASGDGCRSLGEWVAWKLDLGWDTARQMVRTMRRTTGRPGLREALAGGVSYDRVEALSRIPVDLGLLEGSDISAIRREAARRAGSRAEGFSGPNDNYLMMQPSLDEGRWRLWGGLDGYAGAIVDKALSEMADRLPDDAPADRAWRRAAALVEVCTSDNPPPTGVTVFVDARHAADTGGETGVVLEAGPAVGKRALEAILCDSMVDVIARAEDGRYMEYGRRRRVVPPALQRALMEKYHGVCAIDGCDSTNRLQAHHKTPWSQGGATNQENLILLCWFHHHVVIHEWGYQIYLQPSGRPRLRRP